MERIKRLVLDIAREHKEVLRMLSILLVYSIAELAIGLHNESMLVLTQSAQNFSLVASLVTVIATSVLTTGTGVNLETSPTRKSKKYPYGLQRIEILLNFVNMFLFFVANFFIVVMCLERLLVYLYSLPKDVDEDDTGVKGNPLQSPVKLGGGTKFCFFLLVLTIPIHFYLILKFDDKVTIREEERECEKDMKESSSHLSLKIFLNVFKNSLVLLFFWYFLKSVWANKVTTSKHKNIKFTHFFDPALAILVILFYCYSYFPKIRKLGKILMQATPSCVNQKIYIALQKINRLNGVLELKDEHFWTLSPGLYVGSFTVRVRGDTDEQKIRQFAHSLFDEFMHSICVQVEKDSWVSTSYLGNPGFFESSASSLQGPPVIGDSYIPLSSNTNNTIVPIDPVEHENEELPPPLPPPQPELQQQIKND